MIAEVQREPFVAGVTNAWLFSVWYNKKRRSKVTYSKGENEKIGVIRKAICKYSGRTLFEMSDGIKRPQLMLYYTII